LKKTEKEISKDGVFVSASAALREKRVRDNDECKLPLWCSLLFYHNLQWKL